jgi:hypothetical protein
MVHVTITLAVYGKTEVVATADGSKIPESTVVIRDGTVAYTGLEGYGRTWSTCKSKVLIDMARRIAEENALLFAQAQQALGIEDHKLEQSKTDRGTVSENANQDRGTYSEWTDRDK